MSDGDEVIPANVKEPNLTVETSIKKKKKKQFLNSLAGKCHKAKITS